MKENFFHSKYIPPLPFSVAGDDSMKQEAVFLHSSPDALVFLMAEYPGYAQGLLLQKWLFPRKHLSPKEDFIIERFLTKSSISSDRTES